jgi:hypothetical protein
MHTNARAFQPVEVERGGVVGKRFAAARPGCLITLVNSRQRAQKDRRVGYRPAHRAGSVLAVRNRNDSGATNQTQRRFDPDQRIRVGRADHRAVGFGADPDGREIGGDGGARAGARAAGIAVQHVWVSGLAAAAAPTAAGMTRTKIGPLAQVGFADDDRPRVAQLFGHGRVLQRHRSGQRQRSRRSHHSIVRIDIVFDKDRNPMQRSAHTPGLSLVVKASGNGGSIRICFEH